MDDNTPCRINQDSSNRMSTEPDRVWFQLRPTLIDVNLTKIFSNAPDKYGYSAYDLASAEACFTWYAITKVLNGRYPIWANQFDIWTPNIKAEKAQDWHALCYAYGLAENRCIVAKFEKDNPVIDAPEVWIDNPMSPNNANSFYRTTLQTEIKKSKTVASELASLIEEFYQYWNMNYTQGQVLEHVGLQEEAYFRYFSYPDFVTKDSGLVQIKRYADLHECADLLERIAAITSKTKEVKEELYTMLTRDFNYFSS